MNYFFVDFKFCKLWSTNKCLPESYVKASSPFFFGWFLFVKLSFIKHVLDDDYTGIFHEFEIETGVSEFDHRNLVQLKPFNYRKWHMALTGFTQSNTRWFYSSLGNPLEVKGLNSNKKGLNGELNPDLAMLLQCSTSWVIRPTGRRLLCRSIISPYIWR